MNLVNFMMITISMLISVSFYTMLERKMLSYMQIRKGPNKVWFMGILQPFSDAIKLFNKNIKSSEPMNMYMSYSSPMLSLMISIMILSIIPFNKNSLFDNKHNILLLFILASMNVYFILLISWSSNSKYSHFGAIRSIAQMISYEVSFFMIILFIAILSNSYSFNQITKSQSMLYFMYGNIIMMMMWLISCMAETNRSPFDFAEGESELVSGFNIEYMGGLFALIFLSEYMSMLILSLISTILFFKNINNIFPMMMLLMISIMFIWIRGTLPRFRYDMLMMLSWKLMLPTSLFMITIPMVMLFYFI